MVILLVAWRRGLMPALSLRKAVMRMVALSVVLAAVVSWQVTLEKFREPEPYRVRRELLLSSLAMVADHPWAGFGLDTWPVVYPAYARFDNGLVANHAHDDWAEVPQAGLASPTERPILFCPELKRAHECLEGRGASPGPIQDGGCTQFFEVRDLEGNVIEICKEP